MSENLDRPESYVKNCLIMGRTDVQNEYCFLQQGEDTLAHLDGYAIIPVEEYKRLKIKAGEEYDA